MDMSSPSKLRLPHASAGPFWCPPPIEPRNEWREIEALLFEPYDDAPQHARRGVRSFAFVAAALMIGGGVLAWTLMGSRGDCGADCHVIAATAGPTGEAGPNPVATAGLGPRSDATMTEGRSVAAPPPGSDGVAADTGPAAPLVKHRHHRHHHNVLEF